MDRPDDLLRKADVAMFDAKGHGKARHAIFDPGMTSKTTERLRLETEMRRALERDLGIQWDDGCFCEVLYRSDFPRPSFIISVWSQRESICLHRWLR